MNCREALTQARKALEENRIENAPLEGEILLRYVLGIDRAALFSSMERVVPPDIAEELTQYVKRRISGEPTAYITGCREFYGLDFKVDTRVLIPRPETELLVEKALKIIRDCGLSSAADIGTGSGCIAVSLAKKCPDIKVFAVDISWQSLEVAEINAGIHNVAGQIQFLQGSLLEPLPEAVDSIIANLPYVKKTDLHAGLEPEYALYGGKDGLDKIRRLCRRAAGKLKPGGVIMLEIGQGQAVAVNGLIKQYIPGAVVAVDKDLAGIDRVVTASLTG